MTVREFASVVVRFFGLWLLFQCIGMIEHTVAASLLPLPKDNPGYERFITITNSLNAVLYIVLGLIFTWRPQIVADRIPCPQIDEARLRITTTGLMFVCFSVAGLVFVVHGLNALLYHFTVRVFSPEEPSYIAAYGRRESYRRHSKPQWGCGFCSDSNV